MTISNVVDVFSYVSIAGMGIFALYCLFFEKESKLTDRKEKQNAEMDSNSAPAELDDKR